MKPFVELISTGSELLSGRSLNTHARALGGRLRELGLDLVRDITIGDDLCTVISSLKESLNRVDIVMISGGLGPTEDDLTREALAEALGRELVESAEAAADLESQYGRRGQIVTGSRRRQALVLEGATVLLNRVGAAPGQRIPVGGDKVVFVLPGPPREFEAILDDHIIPWLAEYFPTLGKKDERLFLTSGMGESDIVEKIQAAGGIPEGINIAYCAGPQAVEVRLTGDAGKLDEAEVFVVEQLGECLFARERIELEEAVGRMLAERGLTLATAESCTGGLLSQKITAINGSSAYYLGGVVSYANEVKRDVLGVPEELLIAHGAVSEQVAVSMAEQVRKKLGASIGVSITGIAGPTGGTDEKPVGLVHMALADEQGTQVYHRVFHGDRVLVRERAARTVLDMIRRRIV